MKIRPIILAGGSGSRLWPVSRSMYPKQFLPLTHASETMLQRTLTRLKGSEDLEVLAPIVVCNEEHRFIVAEQVLQVGVVGTKILLEPVGRNTAPAAALVSLLKRQSDEQLLLMPADHQIDDQVLFAQAVRLASLEVELGAIATFGIKPSHPETGYGYIQAGEGDKVGALPVAAFHEKPSAELAEKYVQDGRYFWNGGIFLFNPATFIDELKVHEPAVLESCSRAIDALEEDSDFLRIDTKAFESCPSISIDYAVMERTDRAVVVPIDCGWSDVGSWDALWEISEKDEFENVTSGDVVVKDSERCHVYSESRMLAVLGLEDTVIVETDDAVMVASKDKAQEVKSIVDAIASQERTQSKHHRKVYRPWGWYDSIDVGDNFQVKRIHVKPGAKLSVQMHNHRAEHWVVVSGVAEVLNGDNTFKLNPNESTYIPIGQTHALRNPSDSDYLEIIEVQTGSYLGEDDIVRFDDIYGRG